MEQPVGIVRVERPVSLIPVGLKEAALDSPTFRAIVLHFSEQVDHAERWLDNYLKSIARLSNEINTFESVFNSCLSLTVPPVHISEAVVDHDYTLPAIKKYGEGMRDFLSSTIVGLKKLEANQVEPIRNFLLGDIRAFKDTRRQLEQTQRNFDSLQSRFLAQVKTKEPSALREDAFTVHEARRAYLKASMDFCVVAPHLHSSLDKLLVKAFTEQWRDMRLARESTTGMLTKAGADLDRIRGWSREMESGEKIFIRELYAARKQIEDQTELMYRPSRELEDYALSPSNAIAKGFPTPQLNSKPKVSRSEKQGWLNLRTVTGKPTKTMWVRRWFFVKNGIFGWLVQGTRSGGVEESERIGVLLCGVRPATGEERRFCFEVKTKDMTIVLQAESQQELIDWTAGFDAAKKKALEDPASTEDTPVTNGTPNVDPAFAISQSGIPEFTASAADAGLQLTDDPAANGNERSQTLLPPSNDSGSNTFRRSFDVSSASRRPTVGEKDGESGREHALRMIQKLDLSRRGGSSPQIGTISPPNPTGSPPHPTGGIASLISASHGAMPVMPVAPTAVSGPLISHPMIAESNRVQPVKDDTIAKAAVSTLAPSTLANFPSTTNLSASAILVSGTPGFGLGRGDANGGMSTGMLANLWGSSSWGYINRLERGEFKSPGARTPRSSPSPSIRQSISPHRLPGDERTMTDTLLDPSALVRKFEDSPSTLHRKTISLDGETVEIQRTNFIKAPDFPNYYPAQLKLQDAQFRLLFPNVARSEKPVLVFRVTWSPNDEQEFPGRCYATLKDLYFYSNHLGLVLITSISLASISEVTGAPGRDCDFLFLHLKESKFQSNYNRVTIKTFLEPLRLLQRRLNFLASNASLDTSQDLETVMKTLIRFESENQPGTRSSSVESRDSALIRDRNRRYSSIPRSTSGQDLRAKIRIDQGLYGEIKDSSTARFKLPSQPVRYVPRAMSKCAVSKIYDISPKALFHIMFGDKSAVWQLLYHERRAQRIQQGPWAKTEQGLHLRRTFEYQIEYLDLLRRTRKVAIADSQMVDVLSDHLCYVVTDRKTPWHLPYYRNCTLVSKIVITHVAKSKCQLAIYIKVDWAKLPRMASRLVEAQALRDIELDALDLVDVISDQVRKLGATSGTKKAVQIFGGVGVQKHVTEFGASDVRLESQVRRSMGHRTLGHLVLAWAGNLAVSTVTQLMLVFGDLLRWIWKTGSANMFILLLLGGSILLNAVYSSRETSGWWKERQAKAYMRDLGVGGSMAMTRAIAVRDLNFATSQSVNVTEAVVGVQLQSACFQTFQSTIDASALFSTSPRHHQSTMSPSALRLRRTRQNLAQNRHDLLVAMRVVNSIEREVLRVEWEDWVVAEKERCARMRALLQEKGEEGGELGSKLEEYCGSCGSGAGELVDTRS